MNNNSQENELKLDNLKTELINLALKLGKISNVNLDFSIDSVKHVENILAEVHAQYKSNKNMEGIDGIALELAAYIIAVIEKNKAEGKWERDSKEFGKDTFPYTLKNGNVIFPFAWCLKRIYEGDGDNVWTKFQQLVLLQQSSESGTTG